MKTIANARRGVNSLMAAFLHPLPCLAAIALSLTGLLRWVFFHFSSRIWAAGELVRPEDITSWARPYVLERDGVEPQALLLLVLILIVLVVLAMRLTGQHTSWRKVVVPLAVAVAAFFGSRALPRMPEAEIYTGAWHVVAAVTGVTLAAAAAWWLSNRKGAFLLFAAALLPVCFLAANVPSHSDLACILAPALRLRLGIPPSQIYFQYDYFPSLLAVGCGIHSAAILWRSPSVRGSLTICSFSVGSCSREKCLQIRASPDCSWYSSASCGFMPFRPTPARFRKSRRSDSTSGFPCSPWPGGSACVTGRWALPSRSFSSSVVVSEFSTWGHIPWRSRPPS